MIFVLLISLVVVALALLPAYTYAAYAPDEILSLPGWPGALPSKQYSGYLNGSPTTRLHYWLVESESNPETAPTIVWLNGGPGCSSLDGFIYEQGPFEVVAPDYKTLKQRDYRWNRVANVIFLESPVGVGFSYSTSNDYACDDDRTAVENRAALEYFFSLFPEYKNNQLFITGESYAGIYVPTLAEQILKGQIDGSYTGAKLTGIAVGNGCSGTEVGICGSGSQGTFTEWSYLAQTPFVDSRLKSAINSACNWTAAALNEPAALNAECVGLLNEASTEIGHVNLYDIYGDCVSSSCSNGYHEPRGKVPIRSEYVALEGSGASTDSGSGASDVKRVAGGRIIPHGPDACIDSAAASGYLNQPEVMAAIHVRDPGYCWSVCATQKGWSYKSTRPNLPRDTYPFLVANIEVVIYNGDWDACVPYTDGELWTQSLGLPVTKPWHSWSYTSVGGNQNQVGGYATTYDVSTVVADFKAKNLTTADSSTSPSFAFVTVRGGRHEVPETAPAQALELINRLAKFTPF